MIPLIITSIGILRMFGIPFVLIILIIWIIRKQKLLSDIKDVKKYIYNNISKSTENSDDLYLT